MNEPWDDIRAAVRKAIDGGLRSMGTEVDYVLESPPAGIADLAVPCFPMAKALRRPPVAIAEELANLIPAENMIREVWADRGYLNFRINDDFLVKSTLEDVLQRRLDFGKGDTRGKIVLLEHTSVNPSGPIHVGRARNPIIGDTLARCMRHCGYDITTEYYVNDVGKQVVLLTWGLENIDPSEVDATGRDKDDHRLVGFYQIANRRLEEDPDVRTEVASMLQRFEDGDAEVINKVRHTTEMMLAEIGTTLDTINVSLDSFKWESDFIVDGAAKDIVDSLTRVEQCHEEGGALYLDLNEFEVHGKDTRFFFTRGDGTTLYTTRDMAYHLDKFRRADRVIDVLGEDQKLGSQQLTIALGLLGEPRAPECLFYSFVSLPEGKMSTRKGTVVYMDDLIDEAETRAYEEVRKRREDLSEERMREIARIIGRGAIRHSIAKVQPEKPLVFHWEEALNFEGNSAPYLQYSHARACSILRKAGDYERRADPDMLVDPTERKLVRAISRFPQVMRDCGEEWRINALPVYGHELASTFNQFYVATPVLSSGKYRDHRLTLVECTMWVLRNVLENLGIGAPEEM